MAVGSGAPSEDELQRVPHHLIGTVDPEVRLSAGEFARIARKCTIEIIRRKKTPLVVGGSGLYIRTMIDGLAPVPPSDPEVRRAVSERIELIGMEAMIEELRRIDPEYAEKVGIHDRKRLTRALEVWEMTGKSFSEYHRSQHLSDQECDWCRPIFFGLNRPRTKLHDLIVKRVDAMLKGGWIDEVRALKERYNGFDNLPAPITEAVGYKEIIAFLKGETDLDGAREKIIVSTRQFAKRQLTWFRADERVRWSEESGSGAAPKWAGWIINCLERS